MKKKDIFEDDGYGTSNKNISTFLYVLILYLSFSFLLKSKERMLINGLCIVISIMLLIFLATVYIPLSAFLEYTVGK